MTVALTYAIGDVHGCRRALDALLERCRRHAGSAETRYVFLGDYIDRGPDSRGTVELLMALQRERGDRVVCLRGNHEALLLEAAASGDIRLWLLNGGGATLASYGVTEAGALPAAHLAWFAALPLVFDDGLRFFVHAGVDPARPLDRQEERDLVWIREPFLSVEQDYGRLIVHGHTPVRGALPELRRCRLNLDTGAVYGGRLTAAVFVADQRDPVAFLTDTEDARPFPGANPA